MIFKSWLLFEDNQVKKIHNLEKLYKKIKMKKPSTKISSKIDDLLKIASKYEVLRYPDFDEFNKNLSGRERNNIDIIQYGEIGVDDLKKIYTLVDEIWTIIPNELKTVYEHLDDTRKGNRQLMKSPNSKK